jgi:hypothetical protein
MESRIKKLSSQFAEEMRQNKQYSTSTELRTVDGRHVLLELSSGGVMNLTCIQGGERKCLASLKEAEMKTIAGTGTSEVEVKVSDGKHTCFLKFSKKLLVNAAIRLLAIHRANEEVRSRKGRGSRPGRRNMNRGMIACHT